MEMDFAVHHHWWKIPKSYERIPKVVIEDGIYKVKSRRIAMLHRMNLGAIVSDVMMKVKFSVVVTLG